MQGTRNVNDEEKTRKTRWSELHICTEIDSYITLLKCRQMKRKSGISQVYVILPSCGHCLATNLKSLEGPTLEYQEKINAYEIWKNNNFKAKNICILFLKYFFSINCLLFNYLNGRGKKAALASCFLVPSMFEMGHDSLRGQNERLAEGVATDLERGTLWHHKRLTTETVWFSSHFLCSGAS